MRKTTTGVHYSTKRYANLNGNFTQISNDVFKIVENSHQYVVYCYLCSRYNTEYNYAFPSLSTISNDTCVSLSTVRRSIKELEKLGLIKIRKLEKKEYQEYANNTYYIYYPIIREEKIKMDKITEEDLRQIEEGEKDYYIEREIITNDITDEEFSNEE